MKREAMGHRKLLKLCFRLQVPRYAGVGILETLWHLCAREAPRGDIGRMSDDDIAFAIEYPDAPKLIEALVWAGLLDKHPLHRLLVHDWPDHCDDGVHAKLARARLTFADGTVPSLRKLHSSERKELIEFFGLAAADGGQSGQTAADGGQNDQTAARGGARQPNEGVAAVAPPRLSPALPSSSSVVESLKSFVVPHEEKPPEKPPENLDDDENKELPPKDRAELIALISQHYHLKPKRKTWEQVESELAVRGIPMEEYCAEIAPHIERNGLSNPEGFLITFAREFRSRTTVPQGGLTAAGTGAKCTDCTFGCKPDGTFCSCALGQDLARANRALEREAQQSGGAAE